MTLIKHKNRPNFLGSEVGLVLKSITIPDNFANYVEENGKKIVKAGTIFTSPYYGLLFEDREVGELASLMIGGRYIDEKLPSSANSYKKQFIEQGLYSITETTTRPDFGISTIMALDTPSASASGLNISWSAITNAVGYNIYNSNGDIIETITETTYTVDSAGTYYVQAKADNVNYKSSALAVVTATGK